MSGSASSSICEVISISPRDRFRFGLGWIGKVEMEAQVLVLVCEEERLGWWNGKRREPSATTGGKFLLNGKLVATASGEKEICESDGLTKTVRVQSRRDLDIIAVGA